jgi:hypothetical protein
MNTHVKPFTPLLTGIVIVLFLCIVATLQAFHDKASGAFSSASFRFTVKHRSIIEPHIIKHLTFGFDNMLADYYWISAIQDFTGWNHKEDFYLNYFKNISALDPRFSYPYLFAILTAPTEKDRDSIHKVATIADLGIATLPQNWEIPFYMGTMYNQFGKDDVRALHYLKIAANVESAPPVVPLVYSSITAKKLLGRDRARELMRVIRDTTESETIKKFAEKGIVLEEFGGSVENAVLAYQATFKRYPKNAEELVKARFLNIPEEFTSTITISIDQKDGSVRIVEK